MKLCTDGECDKINLNPILEKIPEDSEISNEAEIIKALADPTRLKIVYILSKTDELCVCQIIETLNKSQSTISHHLNILKKAKIVDWRKKGQWIYYSLKNPGIINGLNIIFDKKTVYNFSSFKITKK
ncbi:ArsR/SmtB family transcription factor [Methanobrevibacter wolinii]|uniref:ArsR/SmtB family transcription factor n=1 Tax=Methanobrevibacter wolinii TaxID=190977 RepID=UPI000694D038|nr:metalloregulator ArsR/SmtB family transcription factor [Methanobrevibacter wolinii]MDD5959912.1 metalloregulator ArsR/SmtB family transcription factor [Methanobrevibacter wolinii]